MGYEKIPVAALPRPAQGRVFDVSAYARYVQHICDVLGTGSWGEALFCFNRGNARKIGRYDSKIVGAMGFVPGVAGMVIDGAVVGVSLCLGFVTATAASLKTYRGRKVDLQYWCDVEGRFGFRNLAKKKTLQGNV